MKADRALRAQWQKECDEGAKINIALGEHDPTYEENLP